MQWRSIEISTRIVFSLFCRFLLFVELFLYRSSNTVQYPMNTSWRKWCVLFLIVKLLRCIIFVFFRLFFSNHPSTKYFFCLQGPCYVLLSLFGFMLFTKVCKTNTIFATKIAVVANFLRFFSGSFHFHFIYDGTEMSFFFHLLFNRFHCFVNTFDLKIAMSLAIQFWIFAIQRHNFLFFFEKTGNEKSIHEKNYIVNEKNTPSQQISWKLFLFNSKTNDGEGKISSFT